MVMLLHLLLMSLSQCVSTQDYIFLSPYGRLYRLPNYVEAGYVRSCSLDDDNTNSGGNKMRKMIVLPTEETGSNGTAGNDDWTD